MAGWLVVDKLKREGEGKMGRVGEGEMRREGEGEK